MFHRIRLKLDQIRAFLSQTRTPLPLILDALKVQPVPFVAADGDGLRLRILPRRGESFTFYENVLRRDYLRHGIALEPGDTVIDIGGNIGTFAIVAARIVGEGGRVIAFEPDPSVFARLEENVALNRLGNVNAVNAAVGGKSGKLEMLVSNKSAYSSLIDGVDGRAANHGRRAVVSVRELAEIIDEFAPDGVDLLKVDCEGAEYEILDGLAPGAASRIRQIAMETHQIPGRRQEEIRERLSELGFEVRPTYPLVAFRGASPSPGPAPVGGHGSPS